ncbi:MAG: hypothetical protein ACYC2G_10245 [Gemmatimonadaceae bacterium]
MTRQHPQRGPGALLTLAALLLAGATPLVSHAQAGAAAAAVPAAGTAIRRASNTADRVGANVARAEAITATGDSSSAPPARRPVRLADKDASLLSFDREVYNYVADGRRDPFQSLMANGELRPLITDLRLVAVAYDATGGSVAVLRDLGTNEQYRVRAGQQLGRMRVAAIQPKKVVFTIEEFGYSRQESLALGDLTNARTQQ